jgi:hypothetical protein
VKYLNSSPAQTISATAASVTLQVRTRQTPRKAGFVVRKIAA